MASFPKWLLTMIAEMSDHNIDFFKFAFLYVPLFAAIGSGTKLAISPIVKDFFVKPACIAGVTLKD